MFIVHYQDLEITWQNSTSAIFIIFVYSIQIIHGAEGNAILLILESNNDNKDYLIWSYLMLK